MDKRGCKQSCEPVASLRVGLFPFDRASNSHERARNMYSETHYTFHFVKTLRQHLLGITECFPLPDPDDSITYAIRWAVAFRLCSCTVLYLNISISTFFFFFLLKRQNNESRVLFSPSGRSGQMRSSWVSRIRKCRVLFDVFPGRSATIWAKCPCSVSVEVKEQREE